MIRTTYEWHSATKMSTEKAHRRGKGCKDVQVQGSRSRDQVRKGTSRVRRDAHSRQVLDDCANPSRFDQQTCSKVSVWRE